MTRSTLSISTVVLLTALGCSGVQEVAGNGSSVDASTGGGGDTGIRASDDSGPSDAVQDATGNGSRADVGTSTSSDAGDAGSADVIIPRCEPTSVEAGTPSAGDAAVSMNHRPAHACCPSQRGPGPSGQPYSSQPNTGCTTDSQCTAGANGRCFPWEGVVSAGGCSYDECFTDSTCGSGTPCICRSSGSDDTENVCDPGGNCVVDSDCGPAGFCSPSAQSCYDNPGPYYCHTPLDTCMNDSDCRSDAGTSPSSCPTFTSCAYDADAGYWACNQSVCCPP